MTPDAHMTNVPKAYEGLDRFECRSKLTIDLEQQGFLGPIDEHQHNVGHCYRCNTVVEPRLSPQWFVKMKPLAVPAIKAVKDKTITFSPARWTKVYLNWMENIEDWCISRQIWWGHRLPVWYCDACLAKSDGKKGIVVAKKAPSICPACKGPVRQDEDVLDTWFSSWLWPFSTLGWPKKTPDLDYFYPTNTLVTAQEIIFFWVARMIMAGYFCMNKPPFTQVYIHGTVRDITGKKMSKSLGNIIDPLDIIDKYGTDALRYTLVTATAIGQDVFLSEERFTAGRNFANKLWNATRYVLSQGTAAAKLPPAKSLGAADRWILSKLQGTIVRVTKALDNMLFNDAATALYDFLWHDFCDWYIEVAKIQLVQGSGLGVGGQPRTQNPEPRTTLSVLMHVLETSLRLLHPVMPFVTETLWQQLTGQTMSIMVAPWPKAEKKLIDPEAEEQFERFKAVVTAIRTTRAELNVPLTSRPPVRLSAKDAATRAFFEAHQQLLQAIAGVSEVTVSAKSERHKNAASSIVDGIEVILPLAGLIDTAKETQRLQQRVAELTNYLAKTDARLRDPQFTQKAPTEIIEQTKAQRAQTHETLKKVSEYLSILQTM